MPKKTTRTRREGRTRVNEAQLQAYRARKAETVAHPEAKPEGQAEGPRPVTHTGVVTAWGHVGEEYAMIKSDLIRLFAITALMLVIIVILWFFLG